MSNDKLILEKLKTKIDSEELGYSICAALCRRDPE